MVGRWCHTQTDPFGRDGKDANAQQGGTIIRYSNSDGRSQTTDAIPKAVHQPGLEFHRGSLGHVLAPHYPEIKGTPVDHFASNTPYRELLLPLFNEIVEDHPIDDLEC